MSECQIRAPSQGSGKVGGAEPQVGDGRQSPQQANNFFCEIIIKL